VDYSCGSVYLTELGKGQVHDAIPPTNNEEMHTKLREVVLRFIGGSNGAKVNMIFAVLADGKVHREIDVVKAVGWNSRNTKAYSQAVSKMGRLDLLRRPASGMIQFTDFWFPFGRPN